MKYQGLSGTIYEIEEKRLAGGGEGNIYALIRNENQVAKIFKEGKRDALREEKLRLMMLEKLSEKQIRQITWPQDVIYDQNGFAGYIMPKLVNASSLTELYTEEKYDLRFRLMAAANLCAAIDTVHQMGQVCGDLNPQNIFVNLNQSDRRNGFMVTLVDTDSYHFTANDVTYRCEVGLGEFIAPELQNKMSPKFDLKTVLLPSYTRETDLFALAVHIFCLLMNGCHPFACATEASPGESNISQMTAGKKADSIVCPQPIDNIKNGFFPFYEKRQGIVIPIYAPEFESLPDKIRSMFIRTFVDGYKEPSGRATALEWLQVLHTSLNSVRECSKSENHYYFDHVRECPLCKMEERLISRRGIHPSPPPPIPAPAPPPPVPPQPPNGGGTGGGVKIHEKLPRKYQIGSVIMFICAVIVLYGEFEFGGVLGEAIRRVLTIIPIDIGSELAGMIGYGISGGAYIHIGVLLQKTQLRGKGLLVFYSILLGISLMIYDGYYLQGPILLVILHLFLWLGEFIGFILLIMKCGDWKKKQITIYI